MKIAVPTENGSVFQHFGKTETFTVYETSDGGITSKALLSAGGNGHGALAGLLRENGVELLICGGIGGGARDALQAAGIRLAAGVSGGVDEAVEAYLAGTLAFDNAATCGHHDHMHLPGHGCGEHSCGAHSCGK